MAKFDPLIFGIKLGVKIHCLGCPDRGLGLGCFREFGFGVLDDHDVDDDDDDNEK